VHNYVILSCVALKLGKCHSQLFAQRKPKH
jgi:hypothetical protein